MPGRVILPTYSRKPMMCHTPLRTVAAAVFFTLLSVLPLSEAATPPNDQPKAQQVRAALERMHTWLEPSDQANHSTLTTARWSVYGTILPVVSPSFHYPVNSFTLVRPPSRIAVRNARDIARAFWSWPLRLSLFWFLLP